MVVINDIRIQRDVINYVAQSLGPEIDFAYRGSTYRTGLQRALLDAKDAIAPKVDVGTLRRWW